MSTDLKVGDRVWLRFEDNPNFPNESKFGVVLNPPAGELVTIEFDDGSVRMVKVDALELTNHPDHHVSSHPLMRHIHTLSESLEHAISDDVDPSDPFRQELELAFNNKRGAVVGQLLALSHSWKVMTTKLIGSKLTTFIESSLQKLDKLITSVNVVEDESDLRHLKTTFIELLEVSADAAQSKVVSAWVELQVNEIKRVMD